MKELIEYIIKNILGKKDFEVIETEENDVKVFNVSVPKEEIGIIIGKGGKIINSIKNLIKIKAIRENTKVDIKLLEKE